jgi:CHAT domain-containing protein
MSLTDFINLAIAIFTALAAQAAWVSASASRQAIGQANKEAEESRKAGEESRKIAQQRQQVCVRIESTTQCTNRAQIAIVCSAANRTVPFAFCFHGPSR